MEILGIRAQGGSRDGVVYGFDRRKAPFTFFRIPAFVTDARLQRDPPDRTENCMRVRVCLLKTKIGAIIFRCFYSKSVISDLSRVSPAHTSAEGQPSSQMISGFQRALDQLVILERVQPLDIPVAIVSKVLAITGTEGYPAAVIHRCKVGIPS